MESIISISGFADSSVSSMSSIFVSLSTNRFPVRTLRRSARIFSCRSDSSPVTYKTVCSRQIYSQICSNSVDLPIPGEPPKSTSEPFTQPPPSTLSSSAMPLEKRSSSAVSSSASVLGRRFIPRLTAFFVLFVSAGASITVFQLPQDEH